MIIEPDNIYCGHALDILKEMPDDMVDCVITSPPYWGLRNYNLDPIVWDSKEGCEHEWGSKLIKKTSNNYNAGFNERYDNSPGQKKQEAIALGEIAQRQFCSLCGAWRGSLGLEPTFQLYLDHLMQIMAECRRVMKSAATMFINLGDSFASSGKGIGTDRMKCKEVYDDDDIAKTDWKQISIPPKSLIGIPERFATRMTDDLHMIRRNTIIWYKRNCMPSSAKDRFTVDFEPVYFFTKQGDYWFKQQREESSTRCYSKFNYRVRDYAKKKEQCPQFKATPFETEQYHGQNIQYSEERNMRCVWDIPAEPSTEPHFAMFPQKLVEPMLDAGCPEFVCKKCGKAREEIYKQGDKIIVSDRANRKWNPIKSCDDSMPFKQLKESGFHPGMAYEQKYIGLTDCGCNAGFEGGIVLDPFSGMSTVASIAIKQGKHFVMIEASQKYVELSKKRIEKEKRKMKIMLFNPYIEETKKESKKLF